MPFELSLQEGKFLIHLARNAVKKYLEAARTFKVPENTPKKLFEHCGVFVTINSLKNGEKKLRGCIGYPYPTSPLVEATIDSAINAATRDPRFYPLSLRELDNVVFEVSVLTPPEEVEVGSPKEYLAEIKVGQDGLIVEKSGYKGLLLPQVPVEWEWCEEEFLCQCCIKAGLPPDSWLMKGTKIYKFQAIIFEELAPQGEVKRLHLSE
ncbi:MAG: TIGR00296 family protein [Candidatus Bathyarchaeota archaeon]|nr:TIGR00296 family protein [Candidatus Bathyarchaeota archaeon]